MDYAGSYISQSNSKIAVVICINAGHADDYQVQVAVGQCPQNCIHYVTPSQRIILEELLDRYTKIDVHVFLTLFCVSTVLLLHVYFMCL